MHIARKIMLSRAGRGQCKVYQSHQLTPSKLKKPLNKNDLAEAQPDGRAEAGG